MNQSAILDEIANLLWQIRYLETPIQRCKTGKDPMDKIMEYQFRHKQRVLVEKLLIELTHYRMSFLEKGRFLHQLISHLEKSERDETLTAARLEPQWRGIEKLLMSRQAVAA